MLQKKLRACTPLSHTACRPFRSNEMRDGMRAIMADLTGSLLPQMLAHGSAVLSDQMIGAEQHATAPVWISRVMQHRSLLAIMRHSTRWSAVAAWPSAHDGLELVVVQEAGAVLVHLVDQLLNVQRQLEGLDGGA